MLPTHEHELQTGGETHETTLSKHNQIPRCSANSDSPPSTGSFSKCESWTSGSSACNRQTTQQEQANNAMGRPPEKLVTMRAEHTNGG